MGLAFQLLQFFHNLHGLGIITRTKKIKNLYFSAAGSHPGAGIPGVLSSAKVVESIIKKDFNLK